MSTPYTKNSVIGEIVADNYRTASVFKQFGIDFCCNGKRSIADACNGKNLEVHQVLDALQDIGVVTESVTTYNSWPLDLLADYIEKTHHRYVKLKIEEIKPYLEKIVKVHGSSHAELEEVKRLFLESAEELKSHLKKEELILFPFIRKMTENREHKLPFERAPFMSIQNPIAMMHHEHDTEGERFRKIAALTNNYTPPADACNTYRVTYALIKEFEEDLHLHIHLENNILFPKAIAMEQELSA